MLFGFLGLGLVLKVSDLYLRGKLIHGFRSIRSPLMPGKLHLGRLIADLVFDFWPMLTLQFEKMTAGIIGLTREPRN